ncbi:hypothetical protein DYB28_014272, partial [Aphanomyces astaci]
DRINEFGRNNSRLADLRDELKALKVQTQTTCTVQNSGRAHCPQEKLETLDDANTEIMMGAGDNVQLFIGESFVEVSEEDAQEYLEAQTDKANAVVSKLNAEESKLEARQDALKKVLYARFGTSINLEDK